MARVIGNIPNFINGISQQPAALRLPSQGEAMDNCYPTVAKGLQKRPALEHVAKLSNSQSSDCFVHIINRDVTERYVAVFDYNDTPKIRVFDFDGNAETVTFTAGTGYIPTVPDGNMAALTVADYTFVLNKTKTVAKDSGTTGSRNYEALISFGTVQPGSTIKVRVTQSATTYTQSLVISDTDPSDLDTNYAAYEIWDVMDDGSAGTATGDALPAAFTTHVLTETDGSVIYIASATDFTVSVTDASNGLGIKVIKDKVQYFEDLPRQGYQGFRVQVAGDPVTSFGSYWVEFENATIPVWKETAQPGIDNQLDAATLPHTLVSTGTGFVWDEVAWTDLAVGDADSNPFPSFVDETINDVFFTENRLAFLSGESVIMSQAGEFFNFFRTTTTALVDGDPIDVGTNHTKVSILRHAVPYQEQLLLFSDQTQFRLTKGDLLSPSTVGIDPITEFESSINAKPAAVGNFIFFAVEKADYASMREYFVADDSLRNDAREITGHVSEFLPSGVKRIKGSSNEDVIIMQAENSAANELFMYKYFWSGQNKVQSAWGKWTFEDVDAILGFDFIKSTLYIVVARGDGIYLEKMELDTGAQDDSGTGYSYHMDRKVFSTDAEVTDTYYGDILDYTAYTFANILWDTTDPAQPICAGISGNSDTFPVGYVVPGLTYTGNYLLYSESVDNAAWTKTGSLTVNANTDDAPDGTTTMDELVFTASGTDGILQTYTPAAGIALGQSFTFSFYFIPGSSGVQKVKIRYATGGTPNESEATIDTSDGTISVAANNGGTCNVTPLNGGFYRCDITVANGDAANADVEAYITQGSSGTLPVWGLQINDSASVRPYVKTTSAIQEQALIYDGDMTADDFAFGIPFTASYTVSEVVAKASASGGGNDGQSGSVPITEGRLQIFWMNFRYADTGYFDVTVSNQARADNVYTFNGRETAYIDNEVGALPIKDGGFFRVPLFGRADRVSCTISSDDILPFQIISADWIGNLQQKFKRG